MRQDLLGLGGGRAVRALGLGGASGLGSVIYALASIGCVLGDGDILRDAIEISKLIKAEKLGDVEIDAMDGLAGTAMGLLALHRATGDSEVLGKAHSCASHLLQRFAREPEGVGTWFAANPLTGMSHGAAGIMMALFALAETADGDSQLRLLRAAQSCLAWENGHYCHPRQNWPDFRSESFAEDVVWPCQWCHGAAGIGLARLRSLSSATVVNRSGTAGASLAATIATELRRDVRRAVSGVKRAWPQPTDSLCCGALAGIEFLSEAAPIVKRPALEQLASERLAELINEARCCGDYLWDVGKGQYNIGLFRGISGVGLTILRHLNNTIPNVLTWQ